MNRQKGSDRWEAPRRLRIRDARIFVAALLVTIGALVLSASAQAAEEGQGLVFDATLSLSGDCPSESPSVDPVPDPGCPDNHPPKPFTKSGAVAIDRYGNRFVASAGAKNDGSEGRIDVFDSAGEFVTEVPVELAAPGFVVYVSIAVDSKGNLYVAREVKFGGDRSQILLRFAPTEYNPGAGEIEYGAEPIAIPNPGNAEGKWSSGSIPLAVNPANDHLFIGEQNHLLEFESAAEGNGLLDEIPGPNGLLGLRPLAFAIDSVRDRLYVSSSTAEFNSKPVVRVFDLQAPYDLLSTIDGSTTPTTRFVSETWGLALAADEASGHLFVGDLEAPTPRIYEYDVDGNLVATIEAGFKKTATQLLQLAYDDSPTSPTQGYLFVPSHNGPGRSLAFGPPPPIHPPVVEEISVSGTTTTEAILHGKVNPEGLETTYRIEYTTEQDFLAHDFEGATVAKEGTLAPVGEGLAVSVPLSGLSPAAANRFRIVAENELGQDEADAPFNTYAEPEVDTSCPNQALRTGLSSLLPDCRAYELVTPADTNGHSPYAQINTSPTFTSRFSSPDGNRVTFAVDGGGLPDYGSTGSFFGDPYLATRGEGGWQTEYTGPSPTFAPGIMPGSPAPDQTHSLWGSNGSGAAGVEGLAPHYLRYPDGHSELIGEGSLATDPGAVVVLISENASHVIFRTGSSSTPRQIEPDAAPDGTRSLYDRTPDGTTHVISLLPGDVPLGAGQDPFYMGASPDGEGVAFKLDGQLYLRHDNEETYEVAPQQALSDYKLTCDPGTSLAGATPTYQWLLDGTPIPGATTATYTPNSNQAGSVLQCRVRAANAEGSAIAFGQALLVDHAHEGGPLPRGEVSTLPNDLTVGQTLQCETGSWSGEPSFAYQWYRNGDPIAAATSSSYQVQAEDAQRLIQCVVTATASGTSVLATSGPRAVDPPSPPQQSGGPSITNTSNLGQPPTVGNQLSCAKGSWQNTPTLSVQWLANGAAIATATADTYTLTAAEEGDAVQCEVSATNADGTARAVSKAVAVGPTIESELPSGSLSVKGALAVGKTLECDKGTWTNEPSFAYQWLRNGTPIGAATASTYTLTVSDRETVVQCVLSVTNAKGTVVAIAGGFVNEKPLPTASTPALATDFAGFAEGGERLLYTQGGDLFAYDIEGEAETPFTESALENGTGIGDARLVNVSKDGSAAYFVSPSVLSGEANPEGDAAQPGEQNLYLTREGQVSFVGTVSQRDVGGVKGATTPHVRGLGLWLEAVKSNPSGALAIDSSRATPDGAALLFESNAALTDYDPEGHTQVYRYDANAGTLRCVSCNPAGVPASGEASLQSFELDGSAGYLLTYWDPVNNLSSDGSRAFFESTEALVVSDNDGLRDVYEWEEQGVGSCQKPGGCTYLITAGQSGREDFLYAVSDSGDDVFFRSADLLAPAFDPDETPSIYDARVNGGFQPPQGSAGECLGEACQPQAVAPNDPTPASSSFQGAGNVTEEKPSRGRKSCPKGKRAVRRAGKQRCVSAKKKQTSKKHLKQAKGNRRAGR